MELHNKKKKKVEIDRVMSWYQKSNEIFVIDFGNGLSQNDQNIEIWEVLFICILHRNVRYWVIDYLRHTVPTTLT